MELKDINRKVGDIEVIAMDEETAKHYDKEWLEFQRNKAKGVFKVYFRGRTHWRSCLFSKAMLQDPKVIETILAKEIERLEKMTESGSS